MTTIEDLHLGLETTFKEVFTTTQEVDPAIFSVRPPSGKWSIAEHLHHLILSAKPLVGAFKLPKLSFFAFGKSKKGSRTYDEVVAVYTNILKEGGVASGKYIPEEKISKEQLVKDWESISQKFITRLKKWSDKDLETYRVPHPLIGKMTMREMMYFTHFHTGYHLRIIKELNSSKEA